MNSIVWICLEYLVNCFELLFFLLISIFQMKGSRPGVRKWHMAVYIVFIAALLTIYNYMTHHSVSSMISFFAVIIFSTSYFTVGKWFAKAFWIVFPYAILFCIERTIIDFIVDINDITLADIAETNQYRLMIFIIAKIIETGILMLSYKYRLEITKDARIFIIPLLLSWLIPTYLILAGHSIWMMTSVLLIINFGYLGYIYNQMEKARREKKTIQLKEQNALESAILHEHMHQYQSDVKNKIKVIWELMKTNNPTDNWIIFDELYHVNMNLKICLIVTIYHQKINN